MLTPMLVQLLMSMLILLMHRMRWHQHIPYIGTKVGWQH
jgi:hypothetical protein